MTPSPKFKYSDGGRKRAGYPNKVGDCFVRTTCILTGASYEPVYKAYEQLLHNSRFPFDIDNSVGCDDRNLLRMLCGFLKYEYIDLEGEKIRMENLVVTKDTTMAVCTIDHIFAIKGGVIYDNRNHFVDNKKVYGVFLPKEDDLVLA